MKTNEKGVRWCLDCGMELSLSDGTLGGVCDICRGMNRGEDEEDDDDFDEDEEDDDWDDEDEDDWDDEDYDEPLYMDEGDSWETFRLRGNYLCFYDGDSYDDYLGNAKAASKAIKARDSTALLQVIKSVLAGDICGKWKDRLSAWATQVEKLQGRVVDE